MLVVETFTVSGAFSRSLADEIESADGEFCVAISPSQFERGKFVQFPRREQSAAAERLEKKTQRAFSKSYADVLRRPIGPNQPGDCAESV